MTTKYHDPEIELVEHTSLVSSDEDAEAFLQEATNSESDRRVPNEKPLTSLYGKPESHQYEQNESEVWWHHQLQR